MSEQLMESPEDLRISDLEWCRTVAETLWTRAREDLVESAAAGISLITTSAYTLRLGLSVLADATVYLEQHEAGHPAPHVDLERVEELLASADHLLGTVRHRNRNPLNR